MASHSISRRDLLRLAAGLFVGFNLFDPGRSLLAQGLQGGTPLSGAGGLPAGRVSSR